MELYRLDYLNWLLDSIEIFHTGIYISTRLSPLARIDLDQPHTENYDQTPKTISGDSSYFYESLIFLSITINFFGYL